MMLFNEINRLRVLHLPFAVAVFLVLAQNFHVVESLEHNDTELIEQSFRNNSTIEGEDFLTFPKIWPLWWNVIRIIVYIFQGFATICAAIFLLAILSSKTTRDISYNIYLVFLVIPDMMINFSHIIIPMDRMEKKWNL